MEFRFYFGPDKIPFRLLDNGMVETSSTMPFHGIISRGMLDKFQEQNITCDYWFKYALHLEYHDPQIYLTDDFERIYKYFLECRVLSFSQSAFCAQQYIISSYEYRRLKDARVEVWNIKEGHTSSVWKVTMDDELHSETFIVNVARDRKAGEELKETSEVLQRIATECPDAGIAKVLDIYSFSHHDLPCSTIITRNEWVDDAFEIHQRKTGEKGVEFILVNRFITSKNNPAQITSVLGRIFSTEESEKIKSGLNDILSKATRFHPNVKVDINDGDLVWNGERAIAVALS
ncbi:hypothetical protein [Chryseosolibacter indicus]|uniref:Uncharacterized protein n=1 Tax=Chryseosolibacter indicus TaxID=2782351 RepID=A0ABS5VUP6_9BACT|nr:hypothetical protein [Chryseosolibacter indicus]MBT1704921.1 hypothetical protein [Chryseosolibacter indicus]